MLLIVCIDGLQAQTGVGGRVICTSVLQVGRRVHLIVCIDGLQASKGMARQADISNGRKQARCGAAVLPAADTAE